MPAPAAAAALPFLAKAAGFAKGLFGIKGAAAAGAAAKGAAARAGIGVATQGGRRMAGNMLTSYLGGKPTLRNLAENYALDAGFGVLAGINSPGDIGDKLIAGTSVGLSGGLGGMVGTTAYGKLFNKGQMPTGLARQFTEFGGAAVGDEIGFAASEALQRMKGGGLSAYERQAMEGDRAYRNQIEEELLAKYGLLQGIPSTYSYGSDPFLQDNGLG